MADAPGAGIGVLGSAFNPPHLGHLALAQEALWQLGLAEVILVPTGVAPHKRIADDPGKELRVTMTRLAAADDSRFSVSALETERDGPSYTYETLELLAEERGESDLVFVMGAEIGNSTQKLHARGPIGLRELTTTKYVGRGTGQVRG